MATLFFIHPQKGFRDFFYPTAFPSSIAAAGFLATYRHVAMPVFDEKTT
jgi:hypothetical protein